MSNIRKTAALSIIIPTLNEGDTLPELASSLHQATNNHVEIIVADGGSHDDTIAVAENFATHVLTSPRGRAQQMNAGASLACGDILLFLHADSRLPQDYWAQLNKIAEHPSAWGRFNARLDNPAPIFRLIGCCMNIRSRLTKVCTGDQAIFVARGIFDKVGGFPNQALMEDIEISKRLRVAGHFFPLKGPVKTSPRYWTKNGVLRSIFRMWRLRAMYFFGADPEDLHRRYYG